MSSLCNPAGPTPPLQELMIDCLGDGSGGQYQGNSQPESPTRSVYWADKFSVPGPSSNGSNYRAKYHAALALGATVVCSAGAIMQHTETLFWPPPDADIPDRTVSSQAAKPDTPVAIPPVVSAPTGAAFSAPGSDVTEGCNGGTCQGLAFIEQRLPELQAEVRALRSQMEQFQTQHTAQNLQTYRSILAYRTSDVARRRAELDLRSQQLTQQFDSLIAALAIDSKQANQIANLLQTDGQYQATLQQLTSLNDAIAREYSNPNLDNTQLETLYGQYANLAHGLGQTAQTVLNNYVTTVGLESPDPLWQEDSYYALLQELMDLAHLRQMLAVETATFTQIDAQLTQRRSELAVRLREYAVLQRQLNGKNRVLQQYIAKRQELQKKV